MKKSKCTFCAAEGVYLERYGTGEFTLNWLVCLTCIEKQEMFDRMMAEIRQKSHDPE